jgi:hypothetical protein
LIGDLRGARVSRRHEFKTVGVKVIRVPAAVFACVAAIGVHEVRAEIDCGVQHLKQRFVAAFAV